MARNALMAGLGGVSVALLIAAAVGTYRLFSYLAAVLILGTIASATVERTDREHSFAPYTGLLVGLAVLFFVGLTGIWLTWSPGTSEYTYVLGVPISTLFYFVFIWLLPIVGAIYYSLLFDRIGSDEIVDEIIGHAREAQRGARFPLAPTEPGSTDDRNGNDTGTEPTDD